MSGHFSPASPMLEPRSYHSATVLADGRVFLAGGLTTTTSMITTEIFNPKTGKYSSGGKMSAARGRATATLLPDGRVLLIGGFSGSGPALTSAELFKP